MLNIEKSIISHTERYIIFYYLILISLLGVIIRYFGRDFLSNDMKEALLPWWREIDSLGITALGTQVGDYNILYQSLIYIMSNLPGEPIYWYKLLSVIFDYVLAISCGLLVLEFTRNNRKMIFSIIYGVIILFPTVFLNSSFWGQCDSIYGSFIILSVLSLIKERYNRSFILLGIAFSFKLQTIFIIPLFGFYYFSNKSYSIIKMALTIVITMYTLSLPGLLMGRSMFSIFDIYVHQSGYSYLWVNFPSFWALIASSTIETHSLFKSIAIILTFVILSIGLFYISYKKIEIKEEKLIYVAIWTIYTCILFLPNMHDRYAYLLDLFLIISVFIDKRILVFTIVPLLSSVLLYSSYLFKHSIIATEIISIFYVINYLIYSYYLFTIIFNGRYCRYPNI